jgi:hypothetical protein
MGMYSSNKRRLSRLLALSTAGILFVGGADAADPNLSLAGSPVASGGGQSLSLVAEEPAFDWPIVLRRNDNGASVNVCLDITPLIGPSARRVGNTRLAIEGETGTCIDMAGVDKTVVVHLAGSLPAEGDYKGQLGLVIDRTTRKPYDITIQRKKPANPPKVGIVGVGSDGKLAMTSDHAAIDWPIAVRRDDGQEGDVDVRLSVSPFTHPSGAVAQFTLQQGSAPITAPIKIAPFGLASVKLVGNAPLEGVYTGELGYEVNGVRTPVTLVLTRQRPDFDLKVDAMSKLRGIVGKSVDAQIRLQNTTSIQREIYTPLLARLERLDGNIELGVSGYNVVFTLPNGTAAGQTIPLTADAGLDLRMSIKNLGDPGNYKGVLRFTAPDRKPLDVNFELAMRLCWLWAAGAILLGVVASTGLRLYQQQGRPRLLLQRQAIGLRTSLQELSQSEGANLDADERADIVALVKELDAASDQLRDTAISAETISTRIENARRKLPLLPLLIAGRRRLDAVRPASIAATLRPVLTQAHDVIRDDQATEQQVTASLTALRGLDAQVKTALQALVVGEAAKLRQAIDGLDPMARAEFQPVSAALDAVGTAAAPQPLEVASAALDKARLLYAQIAAGQLRSRLATASAPIGFDNANDWTTFVADISRQLDETESERDPERKVERWNETNRRYLTRVIKQAKTRIDALLQANSVPAATADLRQAQKSLADAQLALARDDLSAASVAFGSAMDAGLKARPLVLAAGGRMGAAGAASGAAPNAGGGVSQPIVDAALAAIVPLPLGRSATLAEVDRSLKIFTIGFSVIVLVFAIVSGMQLLYMPNPAFGCWDVVVSFLWGAGLHAVAGQTFQGLSGLAQQFR